MTPNELARRTSTAIRFLSDRTVTHTDATIPVDRLLKVYDSWVIRDRPRSKAAYLNREDLTEFIETRFKISTNNAGRPIFVGIRMKHASER